MITVTFKYNQTARSVLLVVDGHAGQDEEGHDIVCASASILACTAAQLCKDMEARGGMAGSPHIKLMKGDTTIIARAKDEDRFGELMLLLSAVATGYDLLAHNYPQFVRFTYLDAESGTPAT